MICGLGVMVLTKKVHTYVMAMYITGISSLAFIFLLFSAQGQLKTNKTIETYKNDYSIITTITTVSPTGRLLFPFTNDTTIALIKTNTIGECK